MIELPKGREAKSRKEFWIQHIESAETFPGALKEYCQSQGLNPGTLNAYRQKYGYSKPRKRSNPKKAPAFTPVHVTGQPTAESHGLELPDPVWLAEFLKAWRS